MLILVYGSLRFRQIAFIYAPFGAFFISTHISTHMSLFSFA
jgi:hypothetical protein